MSYYSSTRRTASLKRNGMSNSVSSRPATSSTSIRSRRRLSDELSSNQRYSLDKFGVFQKQLKSPEDLIDELNLLRKKVALINSENETLQGRCRQLQESMERKQKELAIFNQPSESVKLLKCLGESHPQTVRIFKQLHQKIFRLENQLTEKTAECHRLMSDLKYTRIEELRVQLDTAMKEVHRLRKLTTKQSQDLTHLKQSNEVPKSVKKQQEKDMKIIAMESTIRKMEDERQMLLAKNHYLMHRMRQLLGNSEFPAEEIQKEMKDLNDIPKQESSINSEDEFNLVATLVEKKPNESYRKNERERIQPIQVREPFSVDKASSRSSNQSRSSRKSSSSSKTSSDSSRSDFGKHIRGQGDTSPIDKSISIGASFTKTVASQRSTNESKRSSLISGATIESDAKPEREELDKNVVHEKLDDIEILDNNASVISAKTDSEFVRDELADGPASKASGCDERSDFAGKLSESDNAPVEYSIAKRDAKIDERNSTDISDVDTFHTEDHSFKK